MYRSRLSGAHPCAKKPTGGKTGHQPAKWASLKAGQRTLAGPLYEMAAKLVEKYIEKE